MYDSQAGLVRIDRNSFVIIIKSLIFSFVYFGEEKITYILIVRVKFLSRVEDVSSCDEFAKYAFGYKLYKVRK